MRPHSYLMRDFNNGKIDEIMSFNPASSHRRPRSILELTLFLAVLLGYLAVLAFTA
jgi:hypothetical protein